MIKAKKSLGQNFLIDNKILNQIVNCVEIENKNILEIGPGTGNLTKYILNKKPKKFTIIEKDSYLISGLKEKFKENINIINDDILNIDESSLFKERAIVFGNLPYNISTEILSKWIINLKNEFWFDCLVLMFQKEVADRILAQTNHKEYGRLSILSSWKLNVTKIKDINPGSFYPKPKVKSSILLIEPKENIFKINNPKNLEHITNVFFSQKRKMMSLCSGMHEFCWNVDFTEEVVFCASGPLNDPELGCLRKREVKGAEVCTDGIQFLFDDILQPPQTTNGIQMRPRL